MKFERTGDIKKSLVLGKHKKIQKWIDKHLPYSYVIKDDVIVVNQMLILKNVNYIPDNLYVNGTLGIIDSKIEKLPRGLVTKHNLKIKNTRIRELPNDLCVGGNLIISDSPLRKIQDEVTINGHVMIPYSQRSKIKHKKKFRYI
jgi:hypothetical protein